MVMLTVACMILFSFLTDFGDRKLAYKAWLPFNYSVSNCYYIAYAHQIIALIGTALLNVACDMLVCGLLVHVCGQQEILYTKPASYSLVLSSFQNEIPIDARERFFSK